MPSDYLRSSAFISGHSAFSTDFTNFTDEQLSAIEYRNLDACVVAGPGAGKTTVLVERYRRLVEIHGFEPHQILAITFTEKAAANMKAKLAEKFAGDSDRSRELESGWVSTIHGFCMRLLRENAIAAGLDPRFRVLSPRESDTMQWECLNAALNELTETRREQTLQFIEALYSPYLTGDLLAAYEGIRSAGMTIEEVRAMPNPAAPMPTPRETAAEFRAILLSWPAEIDIKPKLRAEQNRLLNWCSDFESAGTLDFTDFMQLMARLDLKLTGLPRGVSPAMKAMRERLERFETAAVDGHAAPFRSMIFDVLVRFEGLYRNRKNAASRVDFNDLERYAIALLTNHPDVRRNVQTQFRQVMLDEFQDINGQQAKLISLLRSPEVFFGVGDRNQSIYGFRHARPEIFHAYHAEVTAREAHSVALLHNFRSRQSILHCVRAILDGAEGIEDRDLISAYTFAAKEEPSIEVLETGDAADDRDAASAREAAWIAHRIRDLQATLQLGSPGETRAADFRDFAVLCRNSDSMPRILAAFDRAGIPYVCGRRESFLVSRMGLDIISLLKVTANPGDSISLATLLRSPLVGVSDEGLLRLRMLARSLTGGLNVFAHNHDAAGIPEPDASRLARLHVNLHRWRQDQPIVPLDLLLSRALRDCGVDTSHADIESFLRLARTTGAEMDLQAFLQELEGLSDATDNVGESAADLSDEDQGNCVRVMTVHAAKGLEFPVVIVAAMDKGSRNESSPVTFTPEHGIGVKWRNPSSKDGKEAIKDSWAEANSAVAGLRERDEENRLLYVAMTRAAEHLILSWSHGKNKPSNWAKLVKERVQSLAATFLVTDSDPPLLTRSLSGYDTAERAVDVVQRPVIDNQHDSAVTVTALAVFNTCPRKYYIQQSLGWNSGRFRRFDPDDISEPEDDNADLSASQVGSAVHEILAGIAPSENVPEARQLADVFLRSELGQRAAASPRMAREWAFIAEIEGTILRGSIDLWFEENGGLYLVDYKTDDVTALTVPLRGPDYKPQLALYAMALERAIGIRPKSAYLHFLRPDRVMEIPLHDADATFADARALIGALRKAQNELRFPLNEGDHCRSCPFYRSACPAGRPTIIEETEDVTLVTL